MVVSRRQQIQKNLFNRIEDNTFPHALIISGPKGAGQFALAFELTEMLLSPKSIHGLFGARGSNRSSFNLDHPDFHLSFPFLNTQSDKKTNCNNFIKEFKDFIKENPFADDIDWLTYLNSISAKERKNPNGNINASECLNIINKLKLKAFYGSHKVWVLWYPEYLGKDGNRLLKLIEEPPANTYLILVAENRNKILDTILSRCQSVQLPPFTDAELLEKLSELKIEQNSEYIEMAIRISRGDINQALKLLGNNELFDSSFLLQWMRTCYVNDPSEMIEWTDQFHKLNRETQKEFFGYATHFIHQLFRFMVRPKDPVRLDPKILANAEKMSSILDKKRIELIYTLLVQAREMIFRNANTRMMMMDLSFRIHSIMREGKVPDYVI